LPVILQSGFRNFLQSNIIVKSFSFLSEVTFKSELDDLWRDVILPGETISGPSGGGTIYFYMAVKAGNIVHFCFKVTYKLATIKSRGYIGPARPMGRVKHFIGHSQKFPQAIYHGC